MNKIIATHNGAFHADESLAIWMLKCLKEYSNAKVIRTRDPAIISTADIVVDVGGIYDPSTNRYDHHQREFNETFSKLHKTKLSSAGLIYKHFGKQVIQIIAEKSSTLIDQNDVEELHLKIYNDYIEAFDGNDNGIEAISKDVSTLYKTKACTIFSQISRLNPYWNSLISSEEIDACFMIAVAHVGNDFESLVNLHVLSILPSRSLVLSAMSSGSGIKTEFEVPKEILVLEKPCPWKETLFELIQEGNEYAKNINYVLYPETAGDAKGKWRIQAVPEKIDSFTSRKPLPESWRGHRDEKLDEIISKETQMQMNGCIFVHATGFIGGHQSFEGALKMATLALQK